MTVTASKYARVLWELQMPQDELLTAQKLLSENPVLYEVLCDPTVHTEQKHRVADRLFPKETVSFIKMLCDEHDVAYFDEICEAYEALKNEKTRTVRAKLLYVTPPDETQTAGMCDFLKRYFHADSVCLEKCEDPALLGGFVLSARNQEWDWSLKGRLAQLSEELSRR